MLLKHQEFSIDKLRNAHSCTIEAKNILTQMHKECSVLDDIVASLNLELLSSSGEHRDKRQKLEIPDFDTYVATCNPSMHPPLPRL